MYNVMRYFIKAMIFMKHLPNSITVLRIIGAIFLFVVEPLSVSFYILYTLCGFTDIIDGFLARKLGLTSELGAKLDSIADLFYYSAMVLNILPRIFDDVSIFAWGFAALIIITRLFSYIFAAKKYHCFTSLHTFGNKVSGLVVFSVPYLIQFIPETIVCILTCLVCAFATIDELLIHITRSEYDANVKSFFV